MNKFFKLLDVNFLIEFQRFHSVFEEQHILRVALSRPFDDTQILFIASVTTLSKISYFRIQRRLDLKVKAQPLFSLS